MSGGQTRPAQLLYVGLRRGVGLLCQISVVTGGELAGCNVSEPDRDVEREDDI